MKFTEKWCLVIDIWAERVNIERVRHEKGAKRNHKLHYWVGLPAVVLGPVAGTSALIELSNWSTAIKTLVGLSGLGAGMLGAVQTFASFAATAERHRVTAVRCSGLTRQLEVHKTYPPKSNEEARNRMLELHDLFSDMEKEAPIVLSVTKSLPADYDIKKELSVVAETSKMVTNLGWRLWAIAEAVGQSEDCGEKSVS